MSEINNIEKESAYLNLVEKSLIECGLLGEKLELYKSICSLICSQYNNSNNQYEFDEIVETMQEVIENLRSGVISENDNWICENWFEYLLYLAALTGYEKDPRLDRIKPNAKKEPLSSDDEGDGDEDIYIIVEMHNEINIQAYNLFAPEGCTLSDDEVAIYLEYLKKLIDASVESQNSINSLGGIILE